MMYMLLKSVRFARLQFGGQLRLTTHGLTRLCVWLAVTTLYINTARAQIGTGTTASLFRGIVVDATKAPLVGVLVTAKDTANHTSLQTSTDSEGAFSLANLAVGIPYHVTIRKSGFLSLEIDTTLRSIDTADFAIMLTRDTVVVPPQLARTLLHGTVTDTARTLLATAMVTVTDSLTNTTVSKIRTDSTGHFAFDHLAANVPYIFSVRRIGSQGYTVPITLAPTDTVTLNIVLAPVAILSSIDVKAKKDLEYHDIRAEEIAKSNHPMLDAYDVILWMRPYMLGNPWIGCMIDSSAFTFGFPRNVPNSAALLAQDPRRFTLGVGSWALSLLKNGGGQIFRKNAGQNSVDSHPAEDKSYPFRLYINGIQHFEPGAKNILSRIPAEDIQEMHYIDCLDIKTPQYRNSLMVLLKPGKGY